MIIYHASDFTDIKKFNLDYLEGGEHALGPGVYFSTTDKHFKFYFNGSKDGKVYITELNERGLVSSEDKVSTKMLLSLLKLFPGQEFIEKHKTELIKEFSGLDFPKFFESFPFLIYKYKYEEKYKYDIDLSNFNLKTFLEEFSKVSGVNSIKIKNGSRIDILVINPKVLNIINSYNPLKDEKPKEKKKKRTKNKVIK